jgi:hypothetical protein
MDLSMLRSVYEHDGPFVTVYLEGRSPGEDAAAQVRLRWQALREQLVSAGAQAAPLDAIETALQRQPAGEEQSNGRVLVAAGGEILLQEAWDTALGAGDNAHWGELPELGAYVREADRAVRELVVVAGHQGAQVRQEVVAEQHEPQEIEANAVEGGAGTWTHKPRRGGLSHNRIQRHAEEKVRRNAKDIAAHLTRVAGSFHPRLLVLAGEVQVRTAVREELPAELATIVVETSRGGRGDDAPDDEALTEELLRFAEAEWSGDAQRRTQRLRAGLARGDSVTGRQPVIRAAEAGAVDTLLLDPNEHSSGEPELLKLCAQTSSAAGLVSSETELADGVAALLRFPVPG